MAAGAMKSNRSTGPQQDSLISVLQVFIVRIISFGNYYLKDYIGLIHTEQGNQECFKQILVISHYLDPYTDYCI